MKLHIDLGTTHPLTLRLMPYWSKLGVRVVPLDEAQIHLSYVTFTKKSSIPKILRLDGVYYNTMFNYLLENRPLIKAYRECQGIVFQSIYSMRCAQAHFGAMDVAMPNRIIYNGMDPEWNDPLPHENFNIVLCSKWRRWKRLEEMLELLMDMSKEYPKMVVHVVGKPPGSSLRSNAVSWHGDLDHPRMRELYRKMDLAIHIAKRDWCPNVVLEFLAAGIPTIVSDKGGGATELVNMVNPELVAMDDHDPNDVLPVPQYTTAWNALNSEFRTNVQSKIQMVIKGHLQPRVALPEQLTSECVAEQYFKFMEEFI